MKKILFSLLGLTLLQASGVACAEFSNNDLKGTYGLTSEAQFDTDLSQTLVGVGLIDADGNGKLTTTSKVVIDGMFIANTTADCRYNVHINGTFDLQCVVDVGGLAFTTDAFGVIDDSKNQFQIIGFPVSDPTSPFSLLSSFSHARLQ